MPLFPNSLSSDIVSIGNMQFITGVNDELIPLMPGPDGYEIDNEDINLAEPSHSVPKANSTHRTVTHPDHGSYTETQIPDYRCAKPTSDSGSGAGSGPRTISLGTFINTLAALIQQEQSRVPMFQRSGFRPLLNEAQLLQGDVFSGNLGSRTRARALALHARLYQLIGKPAPHVNLEEPQPEKKQDPTPPPKKKQGPRRGAAKSTTRPQKPSPEPVVRSRELYRAAALRGFNIDWPEFYAKRQKLDRDRIIDPLASPTGEPRVYGKTRSGKPKIPRPYQVEANTITQRKYVAGHDRGLLILPPRTGKTLTATATAKNLEEAHPRTLGRKKIILVGHTTTIVTQNFHALCEVFDPSEVGMIGAGRRDMDARVISLSIQTWFTLSAEERRQLGLEDAGIIILDEAHYYTYGNENLGLLIEAGFITQDGQPQYQRGRLLIGMTGTPERETKAPLRAVYGPEGFWFGKDITFYENNGFLLKERQHTPPLTGVNYDNLEIDERTGDFSTRDVIKRLSSRVLGGILGDLIEKDLGTTPGRYKKTIAFVSGIEDAREVAAILRERGIRAAQVHSLMDLDELNHLRNELRQLGAHIPTFAACSSADEAIQILLDASRAGEIDILVNDRMLMHGYDDPDIEVVILARAIGSRPLFDQMKLRGATTFPDRPDEEYFDLYDLGGNIARFSECLSYHMIYQIEDHGKKRFVMVRGKPGEGPKRRRIPRTSTIHEAGIDLSHAAVDVSRNFYGPFANAFRELLFALVKEVPGEEEGDRIERAVQALMTRILALTGRRGVLATYLTRYADSLALPAYDELDLLMEALNDTEETLLVAWSEVRTSLETHNNPPEVISDHQSIQKAWVGFVHSVRHALYRYHEGILSRVCTQSNQFLLENLFYHGRFPDEDEWRHLIPILENLFLLEDPQMRERHFDVVSYLSHYAERLHPTLSYYYTESTSQGSGNTVKTTWKLKDFPVRDPVTGGSITIGVWRATNVLKTSVAFVEHPDLEIIRAVGPLGRGNLSVIHDKRTGRFYTVRKVVHRNRYYLKRLSDEDAVVLTKLQMDVVYRLPPAVRRVHDIYHRAFFLYAPSPQHSRKARNYRSDSLQPHIFLRGEIPEHTHALFAAHDLQTSELPQNYQAEMALWPVYDGMARELERLTTEREQYEKGTKAYQDIDKRMRFLRRQMSLMPAQPLRILSNIGLLVFPTEEEQATTHTFPIGMKPMDRSARVFLVGDYTDKHLDGTSAKDPLRESFQAKAYDKDIATWIRMRAFCLDRVGTPYFPYSQAEINEAFNAVFAVMAPDLVALDDLETAGELIAEEGVKQASGVYPIREIGVRRAAHGILNSVKDIGSSHSNYTGGRYRRALELTHGFLSPDRRPDQIADTIREDALLFERLSEQGDPHLIEAAMRQGAFFNTTGPLSRARGSQYKLNGLRSARQAAHVLGIHYDDVMVPPQPVPNSHLFPLMAGDARDPADINAASTNVFVTAGMQTPEPPSDEWLLESSLRVAPTEVTKDHNGNLPHKDTMDAFDQEWLDLSDALIRLKNLQTEHDLPDFSEAETLLEHAMEYPIPEMETLPLTHTNDLLKLLMNWGEYDFAEEHEDQIENMDEADLILINATLICEYDKQDILILIQSLLG